MRAVNKSKPTITYCHSPISVDLEDAEMAEVNEDSQQKR